MNKRVNLAKILIIISFVLLIFCGCEKGPKAIREPINIISIQHDEVLKKEDTVLIEYKVRYPQIKEVANHGGLIKINDFYKNNFDEMLDRDCRESEQLAEEDYLAAIEGDYEFFNHSLGSSYDVEYNDKGLLSINLIEYTYWGGAHPNSFKESAFFDVNTGQKLTLGKLFKTDENSALEIVLKKVKRQIQGERWEELNLFEEAVNNLEEAYHHEDFYFDGENIVIYFQQYAIAPYAAGFPSFKIPIQQVPYFQKEA